MRKTIFSFLFRRRCLDDYSHLGSFVRKHQLDIPIDQEEEKRDEYSRSNINKHQLFLLLFLEHRAIVDE